MRIDPSGNVGIGTTSPLAKFQVGTSSALTNYQGGLVGMMLPTGSGTWIELADNSQFGTAFRISKESNTGIIFNANGREIGLKADAYSTAMADAQFILKTSGNVGIGTTSPNAKLDISGSVNISGSGVQVPLQVSSGSTSLLFVSGSGNVGIGTVSPAYKLSIVGKIALNDRRNSVFIGDNAGSLDDATANINVGIGQNALQNNINGNQNVAIGNNSLPANNQSNNTAVG